MLLQLVQTINAYLSDYVLVMVSGTQSEPDLSRYAFSRKE